MKKMFKKVTAVVLAGVMIFSLAACGSGKKGAEDAGEGKAGKAASIGVAFYQDSGPAVESTKAYLEDMADTLNVDFKYTVLTQTDEAANLTKIQELISSGVDGIICTMDLGMNAIIEECEAAGVYLGGYLSDFDTSFNNAYDQVFKNEYFVGTAADGQNPDDVTVGTTMFESLVAYNERNAEAPLTHVSMAIFPVWAFPSQQIGAEQFVAAVEDYNKTADVKITVDPLNEETDVLEFAPLDTTYFAKHEGTQAIMSFAAGTAFVYPTMVAAGVDGKIKLFTSGLDGGEEKNFGTTGTGTFQQTLVTASESVIYPLVLLLNKINGVEFADQPKEAERVSSAQFVVNSDEAMETFQKSLFYTSDPTKAIYTPEEILEMTAYANPDATYSDLRGVLGKLTLDAVK